MKKNIIAYSLWGDKPMYWIGALKNIELANKYFPGWISRFYIDKNCKQELINTIKGNNVEVVIVDPKTLNDTSNGQPNTFQGMFWRFWAAEDVDVDVFISRDCDSRISEREISAVNEWLSSDKLFHIMRDHPYHTSRILGGMWGCRGGIMTGKSNPRNINISNLISKWTISKNGNYAFGVDQDFLSKVIYPIVVNYSMEHSEFNLKFEGEIRPFPTIRNNYEYVGDIFDENDVRHPDYWKIIKNVIG
jgi:hypothetical protein